MHVPIFIPWVVVVVAVGLALLTDLRQFRIPNLLTLPLLLSGLFYHLSVEGLPGLITSGAGAFVGFLVLLPLYLVGGMGAGDVKLMAALGAWLKTARTLDVLIVSCLLTAIVSFVMLGRRRARQSAEATKDESGSESPVPELPKESTERLRVEDAAQREDRRSRLIPFSVMIAIGLVVAWLREKGVI